MLLTRPSCCLLAAALACLCLIPRPVASQATGLPDLTIDGRYLKHYDIVTENFNAGDCAIAEGCVGGMGPRRLLRFSVATPNIGTSDLVLGDPTDPNNPNALLFEYSPCHGHYHFSGFAIYELLNGAGQVVITGRKQAFCLEDVSRISSKGRKDPLYTCDYQGISAGWQDVYGKSLDCQWLDITGIPNGQYTLRVTIDPEMLLEESDYTNNVATTLVTIKAK